MPPVRGHLFTSSLLIAYYCDSFSDIKFINGMANVEGWNPSEGDPNSGAGTYGSCCAESKLYLLLLRFILLIAFPL